MESTACHRIAVIAPTFNHARTLRGVLDALAAQSLDVIVVNDGSTDDTAAVLEYWQGSTPLPRDPASSHPRREVVSHPSNRGKAEALLTGFRLAERLGFTHAMTIDTDGQHDPADAPSLIRMMLNNPEALVIGERSWDGDACPLLSRFGRACSNIGVRIESGLRVDDSQSGFRVYPLGSVLALTPANAWAGRYGFETQVLTLATWAGIPVVRTPIRCIYRVPGGRRSHFRVGRDSLAALGMHGRLAVQAHRMGAPIVERDGAVLGTIPRRLLWWFSPKRLWRMASGEPAARERFAASVGTGLFMACVPAYGVKTVVCLWLAHRLRLHPLVVIATSSLSTPPFAVLFALASIFVGHVILHGHWPAVGSIVVPSSLREAWHAMSGVLAEWLVGGVALGVVLGLIGYLGMRWMLLRSGASSTPAAAEA